MDCDGRVVQRVHGAERAAVLFRRIAEIQVVVEIALGDEEADAFRAETVVAPPAEELRVVRVDALDGLLFPLDQERHARRVAEGIRQGVGQAVGAGLVDGDDASVSAFHEAEAAARLRVAFHVEGTAAFPLFVVHEAVQVARLAESKAGEVAVVDHLAVHRQRDFLHSVDVCGVVHIVVGFHGETDFPPCLDLALQRGAAVSGDDGWEPELFVAAVHRAFPGQWADHDRLYPRRLRVANERLVSHERVGRLFCLRVAYLEMEVRTAGAAGVAAQGNPFAAPDRQLFGREREVDAEALPLVLFRLYVGGNLGRELLEMGVHGGCPVGMGDVKSVAVSRRADGNARDAALLHGVDGFPLDAVRLEVYPRVKMIVSQLPEIAA